MQVAKLKAQIIYEYNNSPLKC